MATTRGFPVPPPVLALLALSAQRALTRDAQPSAARRLLGGALAAGSAATALSGSHAFRRQGTTVNPIKLGASTALVTDGPFAHTRNPMYVGLTGVLVAHALTRGSWRALLPAVAFVAVIDRLQIPPEEASMASLFGDEYAAYRARVPRWVALPGG
jgi:protein-S-isoprenylcysteine O-methyltransferase Ste14